MNKSINRKINEKQIETYLKKWEKQNNELNKIAHNKYNKKIKRLNSTAKIYSPTRNNSLFKSRETFKDRHRVSSKNLDKSFISNQFIENYAGAKIK